MKNPEEKQLDANLRSMRAAVNERVDELDLDANLRSMRAALNGEQARIKFIREAAIGIYGALPFHLTRARPVPECAATCWKEARTLWDAKPEDC